jgi:chemosensory pili system protein ChpA (sensor histidine kinase/response regulator)
MDVVRNGIKEIRGDIQVKTLAGKGTTFTIIVPYTLSILRVMLVERMGMILAVPADSIKQVFQLENSQDSSALQLNQIDWQDESIPVVRIDETLMFNRPRKPFEIQESPVIDKPIALIVGEKGNRGAIQIDRLWSEQEISIRPIDSPIPLPRGFISSTVLGDGRVVPVVDPVQMLQDCLERQTETATAEKAENNTHDTVISKPVDTILIVDDSINVRRYLALTLEKAGYQVEEAKDGKEAVDKLLAGLSVQAVICDIEMPRLDGYGVLEEVKGKAEFQSLPIAMLTSRSNDKHRKLAMNLGASAYFSKPYNEQELINTMETLITH